MTSTVDAATATPTTQTTPASGCAADCNGNGALSITELIAAVNVALGTAPVTTCSAADTNGDGSVRVNELVAAVNSALQGC